MNAYVFLSIMAAVCYLLVAVVVYSKQKADPLNRSFALFLLCVSVWNIDIAGIRGAPTAQIAELWGKIFRNGLLFMPPAMFYFTLVFTHQSISGAAKKSLVGFFLISCFFAVVNWTPYFTSGVQMSSWGYHVKNGPLYPLFFAEWVLCLLILIYYFYRGFLEADSYQRQRLKYFILAVSLGAIVGGTNFLRLFGGKVSPMGTIAIMVSLIAITYTIVKHRLMDVGMFMAKGLGYFFTFLLLGTPAMLVIVFMERYFFRQQDAAFTTLVFLVGCICALVFNRLRTWMDRAMQQVIVRDRYWYLQILDEFSRRLVTIVDLNRLLHMMADTVERSMGVQSICILLFDPEKETFPATFTKGISRDPISFPADAPCLKYLREKRAAVVRFELERMEEGNEKRQLRELLDAFSSEVCLPLVYGTRLIGVITLGHKKGREMYYREDLDLLDLLANQMAIAIENANLYESLKKSQVIMRRADRLASLGTLVASLAHEIRNPLVSIRTFTQLLPERIDDEEFRNYFLKVATGEIDRLSSLISELLGFARPSEPRLQSEDINSLIEKMELLITNEARKKGVEISNHLTPDLPPVMIDAEQIKQVLLNVFLNAVQAISGEGRIRVETRLVQVARDGGPESLLQIVIRDTGIGIPKENIDRVFDPFFSTRPDGNGLGLAISHQIINEHGGFIDLESEVGKGTSFRIHLPIKMRGNDSPRPLVESSNFLSPAG